MAIKTLTAKDIRIAVKHGKTVPLLIDEYGFSSEEEFFSAICRIFSKSTEANRVISDLKKNGKKSHSREKKENSPASSTQVSAEILSFQEETIASAEEDEPDHTETISSLEAEELELSHILMELEITHKDLVSSHLNSKKVFLRMQKIIAELQRLVEENQKNLRCELAKIQKTSEEMAQVSKEAKTISSRLKLVRAKLEALKKGSIFVYENGNIEIENGEVPSTVCSKESLDSKFTRLVLWPRAKDYSVTLKDLTTVAKLLLWTEYLASSGLAFEISFDSEEVQRFYEAVTTPEATTA